MTITDYYAGGARDEVTLRENRAAYDALDLRYRVLRDVGDHDLPDAALAVDEALARLGRDRAEFPVLVDGGVRRGTDVVKALALGADAVCVGRPVLWGLAVAGEAGARHVLELLREEIDLAIALCGGCAPADIRQMGRSLVGETGPASSG